MCSHNSSWSFPALLIVDVRLFSRSVKSCSCRVTSAEFNSTPACNWSNPDDLQQKSLVCLIRVEAQVCRSVALQLKDWHLCLRVTVKLMIWIMCFKSGSHPKCAILGWESLVVILSLQILFYSLSYFYHWN